VGGPGSIRLDQTTATIVFRRVFRHSIQDVWAAVTDPKQVESWFMARVEREDTNGGELVMDHLNGTRATGRVLEWRPPRAYEYEWNLPPGPDRPEGEASVVRWELSPSDGGTLLVLTHRRLTRATARIFVRGLGDFLDRLSAQLDGRPLPNPSWLSAGPSSARSAGTRSR
jgi:uncharacterized protein YndB with AHSA1/START domain